MEILKLVVLSAYFTILTVLSVYGAHRLWMLWLYYKHKQDEPKPMGGPDYEPMVTVQLAIFNEMNVVERLVDSVVRMDWPKHRLEIQVLDDSTDDTMKVAKAVCEKYAALGFDIGHPHRTDRTGFRAGGLGPGPQSPKGEVVAVFGADLT